MPANILPETVETPETEESLGGFLRDRRSRLRPGPGAAMRRRTPGLRREEVAARAGVSVTWYTWLEQGRGGAPSEYVLERLARALELDGDGREVMFLLAQHRPPPVTAASPPVVTPALQRVLDALPAPAFVKTPSWDVVAWNEGAVAVFGDYGALPEEERNVLRRMVGKPSPRAWLPEWEQSVRFAIGVLRIDAVRAGVRPESLPVVVELRQTNAEFRRLWADTEAKSHGVGVKQFDHPVVGPLALEYSVFAVDGAEGLSMITFVPVAEADALAMAKLMRSRDQGIGTLAWAAAPPADVRAA